MNPQCARCGKVVYPTEKVNCLDKVRRRRAGEPGARRRGAWRQVARTVPGAAALRPLRRSSAQGGRRSPYRRADAGLAPSRAAAAAGTRRGKRALWGGEGGAGNSSRPGRFPGAEVACEVRSLGWRCLPRVEASAAAYATVPRRCREQRTGVRQQRPEPRPCRVRFADR